MIIKSMPRKDASFGQLINYITDEGKAEEKYFYGHNTFSNDPEEALRAMEENAKHIKARKNGNYMYHEVVSITRAEGVSEKRQKEALRDIAIKYVEERAKNTIAFCSLHDDHEGHLHYHLMICANQIGSSKKTRLSKKEFSQVKKNVERYTLENHPELKQKLIIGQQQKDKQTKVNKQERVRKRGKKSKIDNIAEAVKAVLSSVNNEQDLKFALAKYGFEYYRRGNTPAIVDTEDNKKYRFKRLGLIDEYQAMIEGRKTGPEIEEKPEQQEKNPKESQSNKIEDAELTTKDKMKEWALGDFEKRKQRDKAEKIKHRQEKSELNATDRAKEFIFGDFSARDEIKAQKDYERIKDIIENNPDLSTEDKLKEWSLGDFSAREDIEKATRIKEWMEKREQDKKESIIESRQKDIKKKRETENKTGNNDSDSNRRK